MASHRDSVSITILSLSSTQFSTALSLSLYLGSLDGSPCHGGRRRINQRHVRRRPRTEPRNRVTIDISLHLGTRGNRDPVGREPIRACTTAPPLLRDTYVIPGRWKRSKDASGGTRFGPRSGNRCRGPGGANIRGGVFL